VYIATDQKGIIRSKRDIIDLFEYFVEWWCNVVEVPTALMPGVLNFFLPQLQSRKSVPSKTVRANFHVFWFHQAMSLLLTSWHLIIFLPSCIGLIVSFCDMRIYSRTAVLGSFDGKWEGNLYELASECAVVCLDISKP
jgi:hypothetical protein